MALPLSTFEELSGLRVEKGLNWGLELARPLVKGLEKTFFSFFHFSTLRARLQTLSKVKKVWISTF